MKGNECLHREGVVDTWIGVNCEKSEAMVIIEKKPARDGKCAY
jgi:hypothetical protein